MGSRKRALVRSSLSLLLSLCAYTSVGGVEVQKQEDLILRPVKVALVAEHASIQPGGHTRVGVLFEIEPGWHIYAKEAGEAGLPTKIHWSGPKHVIFGPLQWPAAEAFVDSGDIHTFGYKKTVLLWSTMTVVSPQVQGDAISISAKVEWLACKEICLPGSSDLTLSLPSGPQPPIHSANAALFTRSGVK